MAIEITPAQRIAIQAATEPLIHISDPETNKQYILLEKPEQFEIAPDHVEHIRECIESAEQQVLEGKYGPWDPDETHRKGEAMLEQLRNKSCG